MLSRRLLGPFVLLGIGTLVLLSVGVSAENPTAPTAGGKPRSFFRIWGAAETPVATVAKKMPVASVFRTLLALARTQGKVMGSGQIQAFWMGAPMRMWT